MDLSRDVISPERPRRRIWLLYAAAWIPYLGVYASAAFLSEEMPLTLGLVAGLNTVVPSALLGLGVLWLSNRVQVRPGRWGRLLSVHVGAALLYAVLTAVGIWALFKLSWPLFVPHMPEQAADTGGLGIVVWQFFMALMVYTILASLTYAFQSTARLREEKHRAAEAEALRAQAELQALRAQLNPHFLFNTLHSLLALVRNDSSAAEDAIEQFAELLRYASRVHHEVRDEVTFAEEWEFVRNYLALESLRIGDRLRVHADLDEETDDCIVPAFCLQPLVENAIKHAVAPRASGGTVWIESDLGDSLLTLTVRDDGPGADPVTAHNNGGLGLRLVRQRIEALYGARGEFSVNTARGQGFEVRVGIPVSERPARPVTRSRVWSAR